jgi:hypothetical protein
MKRTRNRASIAAYTAVEVLMAMAVLAVGVLGIIASEKVTVSSNLHAKNLAIASHIGQAWLGVLDAESSLWSSRTARDNNTSFISEGAGQTDWFRPTYSDGLVFGAAFDALGNPVRNEDLDSVLPGGGAKFCVDLRFSEMDTDVAGTGMYRVEVRVVWLREEGIVASAVTAPTNACGIAPALVAGDDEQHLFYFLFLSGAVRQVVP